MTNNGTVVYNRTDATTLTNTITNVGSGNVVFAGSGKVTISGGGSITLPAATITINSGSVLEICDGVTNACNVGPVNIVVNGEVIYNRPSSSPIANLTKAFSGSGNFTLAGTSNVTLTGTSTYSGTTTIASGAKLALGSPGVNAGTTGTIGAGPIVNSGQLFVNHSNSVTLANDISGTGSVTQGANTAGVVNGGAGTTILSGSNSYGGGTAIRAGTLQIGNAGATGTLGTGSVVNDTALLFNRSGTLTVTGDISGAGTLTQSGAGTTILTGTNSYGGTTTISAGTLQIGDGGNGGSTGTLGTGDVTDNAALVFNRAANTTIGNSISGSGTVAATITGDLTVAGTITQSNTVNLQATQALSVNADISSTGGTTLASGGSMALNANLSNSGSGAVTARAGDGSAASAATFTAAAAATITQSANADVELSTDGTGNLTPATVLKTASGAGNVVLAAGKQIAAGTGSGGQVTPLSGNSVTNSGSGTLYVYSGTIADTGDLSQLSASLASLNYNGTATGAVNTAFTSAYGSTIGSGPASQLLVRETPGALPAFSIALDNTNLGKTYGNADPSAANLRSALQSTYTGPTTLGTSYGGKSFVLAAADVLADITASRAAGENVGSYAYSGWTNSAGLHTTVGNTPSVNLQIGQRDITLTSLSAANKTYDGNTAASIASGAFGNLANSETLGISGAGSFADKNAANGKTVTVSDVTTLTKTDGSGLWSNYHLSTTGSLTTSADIAKKSVTLTASSISKTYDGLLTYSTQAADLSTLSSQLGISGDTVSAATIAYLDKNAGTSKNVALNSAVVSDGNSGNNYAVTLAGNASSSIAKASATVTGNSDNTRVYDGTTQTVTGFSATGLVNGETASVLSGVSASGSGRNAGNYAVTPTGSDGNYHLSFADGTLQINRAPLSAALTGSVQKPYDGLTGASNLVVGNFSVNGWIAGEGATLTQTSGNYASKNVDANTGTGVVSTSLAANQFSAQAGTDLNNYVLPTTASGAVGRITPANLTVKVNDTATFVTLDPAAATDMGFSFTGLQNGESSASALSALSRSYSGSANPVAGSYSNVFGLATTPTAAHNNYTVSVVSGNLLVVPADQAIVNVSNSSASYGSLTAANAGASAQTVSVDYLAGGNTLAHLSMQSLGSGQWQASDGTAAMTFFTQVNSTGALSTGGYLNKGNYTYGIGPVTGAAAGNFAGVVVNGGMLTVDPLQVSLAASNVSKVYDGSTALPGSGTLSAANKLVGDTLTIGYSGGSFAGKNAGPQNYTLTGTSLGGADQANYALASINYSGSGSISTRAVTLSASGLSKTYDGGTSYTTTPQDLAQLTSQLGVSGDTVSTASAAFANANAGTGKTVSTNAAAVSDGNGGANYVLSYADSANNQILKKGVSLTGISASSKTYDGNSTASISAGTVVGTVGSETLSVSGTGSFADAKAGAAKAVTVADVSTLTRVNGSGLWSNYQLSTTGSLGTHADINRRAITLTNLQAASKTYDGNSQASITGGTFSNLVGTETLGLSGSGSFGDRNAGTGKTVTVADVTALTKVDGSGLWSNYQLSSTGSLNATADVARKAVTLNLSSVGKTYDGITSYSSSAADLSALGRQLGVGGDTVSAATIAYLDKNAGVGKTVALNGVGVNDGNSGNNYALTLLGNSSSAIAKASATVTGNSDSTRVYDGTTQTITGFSATGLVNGETASVLSGVSASGAGRNAGSYAVVPTGSDGNYSLSFVNGTLQINRATLTAALTGSVQKQYDGLASVSNLGNANFSVAGWASGEGASVSQTRGSYASKNVSDNGGNGAVSTTLAGNQFSALAGTDLNNYVLPVAASGAVGRITPAPLGVQVNNSATFVTLDANSAPDLGMTYTGLQNGETAASVLGTLSRSYTGASATPAAGSYSGVFGLGSTPVAANGNYSVTVTKGNLVVVPADRLLITIGSESAVYDQRTASTAAATAQGVQVDYMAGGTTLAHLAMQDLGSGLWQATDGTGQTLRFSTLVGGAGAASSGGYLQVGNYSFDATAASGSALANFGGQVVNGGVLSVTPKVLAVSASNATKTYDGNTALPTLTLTPGGLLAGDLLAADYGSGSFAGRNAGTQGFSLSGLTLSGADRANYALDLSLNGTGSITPKSVTLSASGLSKTYDGTTAYTAGSQELAQLSSALGVAGDQVTAATLAFADAAAGNSKSASTRAAVVSDGNGGANYVLSYADSANNQILKKDVSLTGISASSKTYDGNTTASINAGTVVGTVGSETLSVQGQGSFADRNAGTGKVVTVADVAALNEVDGTGQWSNYRLVSSGNLRTSADVAKKSVALSPASVNKTYDGTTDYTTQATDLSALSSQLGVSGDSVMAATLAYTDPNAGSGKTLTLTGVAVSDGNGGNNYTLALADNHSSAIAQAELTVSALDAIKAQDGAAYRGGNGVTYAGFVHGETQAVLDGMLAYGGNSQGAVSPGDYTLAAQGLSGRNYRLNFQPGTLRIVALPPPPPSPAFNGFGNTSNTSNGGTDTGSGSNGVGPDTKSNTGSGLVTRPDAAADRYAVWMQVVRLSSEQGSGFTLVYVPTALKNAGQGFRFTLPEALLGDDPASSIQVSTQAGESLPDWLHFDRDERMFIASSVPAGALPLRVRLVSARHQNVLQLLEASI